jgi:16S rRNA (uracil1498-N3)-methyltransferase
MAHDDILEYVRDKNLRENHMPNYRLLIDEPIVTNKNITLSKSHSQHICKVLRLKQDDIISVFHPDYGEFSAKLLDANPKAAVVQIQQLIKNKAEQPACHLHLAQVISRGDRMDYSIQKATELGVHEITPILSKRCGVQLPKERLLKRMQHWQGVILSAVQQCGRINIPKLNPPIQLNTWLAQNHTGVCLAALVNTQNNALNTIKKTPDNITVLIGPEGGFAPEEEQLMQENSILAWQLGPRVLRTETAGVVALTLLQNQFGDFN